MSMSMNAKIKKNNKKKIIYPVNYGYNKSHIGIFSNKPLSEEDQQKIVEDAKQLKNRYTTVFIYQE